MNDFGTGPLLKDASPWLRDDAERRERILDVAERNSVIEGLPPFDDHMRERLRRMMAAAAAADGRERPNRAGIIRMS
jgi:hypothetical protein